MNQDNIQLAFGVITVLVVIVAYVCKIEYHFKYLKIIYPDRLGHYKSRAHAQSKFLFAPDIDFELLLPFFREKKEIRIEKNEVLIKVKRQIRNSLWTFWTTIIFVAAVFVFVMYLT